MVNVVQLAARIKSEGGPVTRFVSMPRLDGSRFTVWHERISQNQWFELLKLLHDSPPVAVPAGTLSAAQHRSIREAEESAEPRRGGRRR